MLHHFIFYRAWQENKQEEDQEDPSPAPSFEAEACCFSPTLPWNYRICRSQGFNPWKDSIRPKRLQPHQEAPLEEQPWFFISQLHTTP